MHDDVRECLYGGAAGGGKTDAILMAALQYVHVPGYAALVLMRTYSDLALPGAAMDRARAWLAGTRARAVDGGRAWRFPSGAILQFGHLDHVGDEERYRTAEFQYIGLDELTRFREGPYLFLQSRLRRLAGSDVPVRIRAATNPGGIGHEWVKKRFIPAEYLATKDDTRFARTWWQGPRLFVPARLEDNPSLDAADYELSLAEQLPVVRARLRQGDWSAHTGGHFQESWFKRYDDLGDAYYLPHTGELAHKTRCRTVVAMDPAGGVSESADHTAIVVLDITPGGSLLVVEVVRERLAVEKVVPRLAEVCLRRRPDHVAIEEAFLQSAYIRQARDTPGIPTVQGMDPGGRSKLVRATPAILRAEAGAIFVPRDAPWLEVFLGEVTSFTGDESQDASDDQVDALAWAVIAADRFGRYHSDGPMILGKRGQ